MITKEIKNVNGHSKKMGNKDYAYQIISTEEEFEATEEEWTELTNHSGSKIFQTFDWQRIWWNYYGKGLELNIVLIRKYEKLIGILPTFIDSYQSFGKPVYRCLRFIGSTIMQPNDTKVAGFVAQAGYLDVIARSGYEDTVIKSVQEYLNNYCSEIHRIAFDEVPEDSLLHSVVDNLKQNQAKYWNISLNKASACPAIQFPESWDQFLSNLSSNARYQIRRDVKKVYNSKKKLYDLKMIESAEEVITAYQTMVDYHQKRWNKRGLPGNYANKSRYDFRKEVLKRFYELGYLQFQVLTPKDKPDEYLALDLLFNYKNKIYLIERAFNGSADKSHMGFGNILLYSVLKEGMDNGAKEYDFLRGTESYKLRTANHIGQNLQITFDRANNFKFGKKYLFELIQLRIEIKRRFNWEVAALQALALEKNYFRAGIQIAVTRFLQKWKKINS
ncbi:MAG TPA: GNAT family N-acetyltransferase [Balneolaceae bacterium]